MAAENRINCISLATKHWKENAIAPAFWKHMGASIYVPWMDTDVLGTFSGDMERPGTALETAILKARLGMQLSKLPYGVASEGSFGPHPSLPLLPCDTELLVYIDDERRFMLHETLIAVQTNYAHACTDKVEQARTFLAAVKFPSHGVIVRPNLWQDRGIIYNQVINDTAFEAAFSASKAASGDGKVRLETDMRAFRNPTRMQVIAMLAERLAKRLATTCPACDSPGWGRVRVEYGLPCRWCGDPTEFVKAEIEGCVKCDHVARISRSGGLRESEPENCSKCNR